MFNANSLATSYAVNSGPLLFRTYANDLTNNTYALTTYDVPVSSNRVLMISTSGLVMPTDAPILSTITLISSLQGNAATLSTLCISTVNTSTLTASTITTSALTVNGPTLFNTVVSTISTTILTVSTIAASTIDTSSLTVNGPALFNGVVANITGGGPLTANSSWWNKYTFIVEPAGPSTLITLSASRPADGTFLSITNAQSVYPVYIQGTNMNASTLRTLASQSTLRMIFNSTISVNGTWYSITNN